MTFLCDNEDMKGVLDAFGMDIKVQRVDKEHFRTTVMVCPSPTFYGWVFQWEGRVCIEGPDEVLATYLEMAGKAADRRL